nr:ribonuclease H-like domain-containing protein [Tanacetum cinerariifolium]
MTDYSLWEVIKNGNKVLKRTVGISEETYEPTSADEKLDQRNEMKARGTVLMALTNKDQPKFQSYQDENLLMKAIKKRYGGNKESKNVERTLLKQQYENFTASSSKTMDQTFNRLQKLISQLEIQGEEMDLHLEMAMLTIRARRFMKRTGRNLDMNGQRIGFDKSKVECFNCHKNGHFVRECRALKNQNNRGREYGRKTILVKFPTENALIAQDGNEGQVSDKSKAGLGYKEITPDSFVNSSKILEKHENRSDKEYHAVPPPLTGNYMPSKCDIRLIDEHFQSMSVDVISNIAPSDVKTVKTIDVNHRGVFSTEEPKPVMKNNFSPTIIVDWHSDDEREKEISPIIEVKTVRPSIEKIKYVKPAMETDKTEESPKQHKHHSRGNKQNWNNLISQRLGRNFKLINKACYGCGSFEHLQGFVPQAVLTRLGKINTAGANVNIASRPVNTTGSKSTMNHPRLKIEAYTRGHSHDTRPNNKFLANKNSIFNKKVNTVRVNDSTARDRAVRNPHQKEYKENGVIDSGCSRHITGNKCYLTDFRAHDGGAKFYLFPRFLFFGITTPLFDSMMVQATTDMRKQRKEAKVSHDESKDEDHVPTPSNDPLPSGEDSFILNELMVFCTNLQEQVLDLQEAKGRTNDDEMFGVDDLAGEEVVMETKIGVKDSVTPTTDVIEDEVVMAQALATLKSTKPKVVQSQIPIVSLSKDKGKAKMIEPEVPIKKKDQMRIDEENARKLEAKEKEAARISRA